MTIFFDPTEGRQGTAIPEITKIGVPMNGLERATGADIAIVADTYKIAANSLEHPASEEVRRAIMYAKSSNAEISRLTSVPIPNIIKIVHFSDAIYENGILIQRKSHGDILNSITELARIIEKMLVWTIRPWLVTTGIIGHTDLGKVVMDGRATDFNLLALQGALDAWQERGGYFATMPTDHAIYKWLQNRQKKINEPELSKIVYFRKPIQQVVGPDNEDAWISTLATFPGIGTELAKAIGEHAGTLANALCFLSDELSLKADPKPHGFGALTSAKARQRFNLGDGQRLAIVDDSFYQLPPAKADGLSFQISSHKETKV